MPLFHGTSSVPVSWAKAIGAAKTTHEKCISALAAANKFPHLLSESQNLSTIQGHQAFWSTVPLVLLTQQREAEAAAWLELSRKSSGTAKVYLLQKASKKINAALASSNRLQGASVSSHELESSFNSFSSLDDIMEQPAQPTLNRSLSEVQEERNESNVKYLEKKRDEINADLEQSQKPSWASWLCSFFNIPKCFYFWSATPATAR